MCCVLITSHRNSCFVFRSTEFAKVVANDPASHSSLGLNSVPIYYILKTTAIVFFYSILFCSLFAVDSITILNRQKSRTFGVMFGPSNADMCAAWKQKDNVQKVNNDNTVIVSVNNNLNTSRLK